MTLETLNAQQVNEPVALFDLTLVAYEQRAAAHAAVANGVLKDEATRPEAKENWAMLQLALKNAQQGVKLDPHSAQTWATLALLLISVGERAQAHSAARRAVMLTPSSWRHAFRLSIGSWGDERLAWVDCTLALVPDFPPARFLSAMVHVARGEFQLAEEVAAAGAAMQSRFVDDDPQFPASGLHWLLGLLHLRKGDVTRALECFHREASDACRTSVYVREHHVNALTAAGFAHLQGADCETAIRSFRGALDILPSHPPALIGLVDALVHSGQGAESKVLISLALDRLNTLWAEGPEADGFFAGAVIEVPRQKFGRAVEILEELLKNAPPGQTGWMIPIDPCFAPLREEPGFEKVSALLASRAS